jgi:nitrate reductase gamma subunit
VSTLLWGVLPYVTIAVLVAGCIWRYRYDQFGWTTRSSQLYESRLLRIGSPLFHFGILVVVVGHFIGLVIPESWTSALGLSETAYHVQAVTLGGIAGFATLIGVAILIYRRRTTGPVFMATTRNDKAMYVVLVAAIVFGLATTLLGAGVGEEQAGARIHRAAGLSVPSLRRLSVPPGGSRPPPASAGMAADRIVAPSYHQSVVP